VRRAALLWVTGLRAGSLGRKLAVQSVGNFVLNSATFVFNLVMAVLLSRLIGAEGYGAYAFAVAFAMLLAVPALLGLPPLVVRSVAAYRVRGDWGRFRGLVRRVNQAGIAAAIVLAAAAAVAFRWLDWPGSTLVGPTLVGLALVPLVTVVNLRQSTMQGLGYVVLGRVPEALVATVLTIVLVLGLEMSLEGGITATWAVAAQVLAAAVAAVVGVYLLRRTLPREAAATRPVFEERAWLSDALPLLVTGGFMALNLQAGTVLTGAIAGSQEAGVYSVAFRVAGFLPFVLLAATPALMPTIAELHERREPEKLQRVLTQAARTVFFFSLPLAAVVLVFARPILGLFGEEFGAGVLALRIMCLGQLVNLAAGFSLTILAMTGAMRDTTKAAGCAAVVNVVLSAALIPGLGADGAAIATAVSTAVMNILATYLLWRERRIYSAAVGLPQHALR
jgi:O-antigen/teichoic acid export membrane protein